MANDRKNPYIRLIEKNQPKFERIAVNHRKIVRIYDLVKSGSKLRTLTAEEQKANRSSLKALQEVIDMHDEFVQAHKTQEMIDKMLIEQNAVKQPYIRLGL